MTICVPELTFVCFKWRPVRTGFQLPSVCQYTAKHVNVLARMFARHLSVPHRVVCITDQTKGFASPFCARGPGIHAGEG